MSMEKIYTYITSMIKKNHSCDHDILYTEDPAMEFRKYFERFYKYFTNDTDMYIIAYIYLTKLSHKIIITDKNIHKIFAGVMSISHKYHDEHDYKHIFYSELTGINKNKFKNIIIYICMMLEWKLFVSVHEFMKYKNEIL